MKRIALTHNYKENITIVAVIKTINNGYNAETDILVSDYCIVGDDYKLIDTNNIDLYNWLYDEITNGEIEIIIKDEKYNTYVWETDFNNQFEIKNDFLNFNENFEKRGIEFTFLAYCNENNVFVSDFICDKKKLWFNFYDPSTDFIWNI